MHESDPYPYDAAYDPAAVRSQRMERRRRNSGAVGAGYWSSVHWLPPYRC